MSFASTTDSAAAMAFYRPLFDWKDVDLAPGAGTMLQVRPPRRDRRSGIHARQSRRRRASSTSSAPCSRPTNGCTGTSISTVADRDDSVATAEWLGDGDGSAMVMASGDDMRSRRALVRDPQGVECTVSQFTPPDGTW